MRILVTGHAGYIGTVMVPFWLAHIFDHPLYARRDNLVKHHSLVLDAD